MKADSAARLIAATADIALVIDKKGVVKDVTCASADLLEKVCGGWLDKNWLEIVAPETRKKAEELLKPSPASQMRWRQINHPVANQPDIPVRYTSIPLGTSASGRTLVFGHDLRPQAAQQQRILEAQATMEREYERLRHAETRYRALFQVSTEAVLVIDATNQRVIEANPAASQLLANGAKAVSGRQFAELFTEDSAATAIEALASAQTMPRVEGVLVESLHGGRQLMMAASLVRQNRAAYYLVRLAIQNAGPATDDLVSRSNTLRAVEMLPDGFVIADKDRRIRMANAAFLELCELAQASQVKGEPLDRWLGRVSVDVEVLLAHVRENGSTRRYTTVVRGEYGARSDVEISAVFITSADTPYYALSLRRLEQPAATAKSQSSQQQLPRSVEQLTNLVGRVPLKEMVRETTDIVERLCIEAALDLTRGNRASAAEMLGLSRQSFYVKLRRHGLGEPDADEPDSS